MRGCQVTTSAEIGDALAFQPPQHFAEGLGPVITRVVVGQSYDVEVPLQQWQHAGMGAEGVGLVRLGGTASGDHAFQVADAYIGGVEQRGEGGERVVAGGDAAARSVVQHHVADEGEGHRGFGGARPGSAEQPRQGGDQALHGVVSSATQRY